MSFSNASLTPTFPGSLPPCPASITIMYLRDAVMAVVVAADDVVYDDFCGFEV